MSETFTCPFCGSKYYLAESGFWPGSTGSKVHPTTCYNCKTQFPYRCPVCNEEEAVGRNFDHPVNGDGIYACCHEGSYWTKEEWMEAQSKPRAW